MKYVSWICMSTGVAAMKIPDNPPITNIATNATACSMGTWKRMLPRHIVPIQLNTFTAEGTAITSVDTMKDDPRVGFIPLMNMWWPHTIAFLGWIVWVHRMFIPLMNMWWPHTIQPRNAIPMIANTMEW